VVEVGQATFRFLLHRRSSIRQHTSACVSMRRHTSAYSHSTSILGLPLPPAPQLLRCQYLYSCTSKASKLNTRLNLHRLERGLKLLVDAALSY
jgi:hypothetical protein